MQYYLAIFKKESIIDVGGIAYDSFNRPSLLRRGTNKYLSEATTSVAWWKRLLVRNCIKTELKVLIWFLWTFLCINANYIEYAHLKCGDTGNLLFCVYTTNRSEWFLKVLINFELRLMTQRALELLKVDVVSYIVTEETNR